MDELEKLEKRWKELIGKPRSKQEIEETSTLSKQIEQERAKELAGLIAELKDNGITISSIWDLVNTKEKYPKAISVLLKYLPKVNNEKNKEGIIRALTVKEAKGIAAPPLINEYERTPKEKDNLRWVIGNAIATVMTSQDVEWLFSAVKDKRNAGSRRQLIKAVGTVKSPKALEVLTELLEDEEVRSTVLEVLKKLNHIKRGNQ